MAEEFTDEELEQIKNDPELKALFNKEDDSGYPAAPDRDNLLKFFRDVVSYGESDFDKLSKSGNLKSFEIGNIPLSVRDSLFIARYAESENLNAVAKYLRGQANIVVGTSLSRNAKLLNLIVTQRKMSGVIEPKRREVKSGLFGDKVVESGGDD